ncbi:hypothetical protein [Gloeocapsopsis sp. IPPAS B-1203]|nr:hypothetical protein [Gloeocapsopsis sp. IPPAS B-1203]
MQLEDYFNLLAPNDIRLKVTQIGIETILYVDLVPSERSLRTFIEFVKV